LSLLGGHKAHPPILGRRRREYPANETRRCERRVGGVAAQYDWFMQRRGNRRTNTPKRARRSTDNCDAGQFDDPDWVWVGDRWMFVVGHTPGGAPFGCFEDELEDVV
jgi:hypothetical protein